MKKGFIQVSEIIKPILDRCIVNSNVLYIPSEFANLDRSIYLQLDKILKAMGGTWNRKLKGHEFNIWDNVQEILDNVIISGAVLDKKIHYQQFFTPKNIAKEMAKIAFEVINAREQSVPGYKGDIETNGLKILEPSAGQGALVDTILDYKDQYPNMVVVVVDIDEKNVDILNSLYADEPVASVAMNFLEMQSVDKDDLFDIIIANPPFAGQADVDHVNHMLKFLKPGGVLITIMAAGFIFRTNKKVSDLKAILSSKTYEEFEVTEIHEGTFQESGTMVKSVLLKVVKDPFEE